MRAMLRPRSSAALGPLEEREPRTLWCGEVEYLQGNLPPAPARYVTTACTRPTASASAGSTIYGPAPARPSRRS